ncbi:MAG: hypothetical protein U0228_13955 [Myxococcaceae bacterium]
MRALTALFAVSVVACATPGPTPARAPSPQELQRRAFDEHARHEARLRAGVDALLARAELGRAAATAASQALSWCEAQRHEPNHFSCTTEDLARFTEVTQNRALFATPLSPTQVDWKIVTSPSCADLEHVLGNRTAEKPRLTATLELLECSFSSTPLKWKPAACPATGATCRDGASPTRDMSNCGDGRPCQPSPLTCPCLSGGLDTRASVKALIRFGTQVSELNDLRGGVSSIISEDAQPKDPLPQTALAYWSANFGGLLEPLGRSVNALERVHAAPGSDDAALACAESGARGAGLSTRGGDTCEGVYEREPTAPAVKDTKPRLPEVVVTAAARRMKLLTDDEVLATKLSIEQASAGWSVKISRLGFITQATHRTGSETGEQTARSLREFVTRHRQALGFATTPEVKEDGGGFSGPQWRFGPVVAKSGIGDVTIDSHAWPFQCPGFDAAVALKPWLGVPMLRPIPGQPCDNGSGDTSCQGLAPSSQQAPLSVRDVAVQPKVVLEVEGEDEVLLKCAAQLTLRGSLVGKGRLPDAIDLDTGAAMVGALLTEEQLR